MSQCSTWKLSLGLAVAAVVLTFANSTVSVAQDAVQPKAHPTKTIDPNKLVPYKNSVPALVASSKDEGPAGSAVIEGQIGLHRDAEIQEAVDLLEKKLRDSEDPLYHQWLTPKELGENFPPSADQVSKLSAWLESQGLAVTYVDAPRLVLTFSGPATAVEKTFNTEIHNFRTPDGAIHFSNVTNPSLPGKIYGVTLKLNNFSGPTFNFAGAVVGPGKGEAEAKPIAPIVESEAKIASGTESLQSFGFSVTPGFQEPGVSTPQTLTVTLKTKNGEAAPRGNITILGADGLGVIGAIDSSACKATGKNAYSCSALWSPSADMPTGTHRLAATYNGDSKYAPTYTTSQIRSFGTVATSTTVSASTINTDSSLVITFTSVTTWTGNGAAPLGTDTVALTCIDGSPSSGATGCGNLSSLPAADNVSSCTVDNIAQTITCSFSYNLDNGDAHYGSFGFQAAFSGDTTYAASNGAVFADDYQSTSGYAGTVSITPSPQYTAPGSGATITYTVIYTSAGVTTNPTTTGGPTYIELTGAPIAGGQSITAGTACTWSGTAYTLTCNITSVAPTSLAAGTYTVNAEFSGNYFDLAETGSTSFAVTNATETTSTAVTLATSPVTYGSGTAVSVASAVTWTGTGSPTGTLTVSDAEGFLPTQVFTVSSCPLSGKTYTCTYNWTNASSSSASPNKVTAVYSGNSNFIPSSGSANLAINYASGTHSLSTFTIAVTPGQTFGTAANQTISVDVFGPSTSHIPTGSVVVSGVSPYGYVTTFALTGCSTTGGHSYDLVCTYTPLTPSASQTPGTYQFTAAYGGDTYFTSQFATGNFTISKQGPTATMTSPTAGAPVNQSYGALSAFSVSGTLAWTGTGTPPTVGNISFTSTAAGAFSGLNCTGSSSPYTCTATFTPTSTDAAGNYGINLSYTADANYAAAVTTQTANYVIGKLTPTFGTMSFSPAASEPFGTAQAITISDTLAYTGPTAPTGAVRYNLNGTNYTATCTGSSSPLTCTATVPAATIAALPVNTYTVTASYTADTNYTAATGASGTFTITKATITTIQMTASNYSSAPVPTTEPYGATTAIVVYATLSPVGSTGVTAADVMFATSTAGIGTFSGTSCSAVSGVDQCHATFTPNGTAVPGSYDIQVSFSGDNNYNAAGTSTNGTGLYVVTNATPTLALTPSPMTSLFGSVAGITLTATATSGRTPTGTVTFSGPYATYGSLSSTTCTLNGSGTCSVTFTPNGTTAPGTYSNIITGTLGANGNFNSATANDSLTITLPGTSTTATNPNSVSSAEPNVWLYATVSFLNAAYPPTGTWTWVRNATAYAEAVLPPFGQTTSSGTLTVAGLTDNYSCVTNLTTLVITCQVEVVGGYGTIRPSGSSTTFTPTYSGDTYNAPSTGSNTFQVSSNAYSPTIAVTTSPTTVGYGAGTSVTYTVKVTQPLADIFYGALSGEVLLSGTPIPVVNSFTPPALLTLQTGCSYTYPTVTCTYTAAVPPGTAPNVGYTITAQYTGDRYASGVTATTTLPVTQQSPGITLTAPTTGSVTQNYGGLSAFPVSATLTWTGSGAAPASSNVIFSSTAPGSFSTVTCDATSPANCTAVFTPTPTDNQGTYDFSVSFAGGTNYGPAGPSTITGGYIIAPDATSIALVLNSCGSASGGVDSCSGTVTITNTTNSAPINEGSVTLMDTTTNTPFTLTVTNGVATFTGGTGIPGIAAGLNNFTASFSDTTPGNFLPSGPSSPAQSAYITGILVTTLAHDFSVCYTNPTPSGNPVVGCGQATYPADTVGTLDGSPICNGSNGILGYTCTAPVAVIVTNWSTNPIAFNLNFTNTGSGALSRLTNCPAAPATLAAGANCTIIFNYNPPYGDGNSMTSGTYEAGGWSITIPAGGISTGVGIVSSGMLGDRSGPTGFPVPAVLAGFAVLQNSMLGVSSSFSVFPSVQPGVTSNTLTISVTNSNPAPVNFTVTGPAAPFTMNNTCASSLAANSTCQIYVTMESSTPGNYSSNVTIVAASDVNSPIVRSFSGSVVANALVLNTNSHNFGNVTTNTTQTFGLSVTNDSGSSASVGVSDGGAAGYTVVNHCPATLANGAQCQVTVTFDPTTTGTVTDTVTITSNMPIVPGGVGSGPYTDPVTFTGTGIGGGSGQLTASSVQHNWGNINEGTNGGNYGVQLTNGTTSAVTLSYTNPLPTEGFTLVGSSCGASLAVNATCEMIFNFTPNSIGSVTAVYGISADGGAVPLYFGANTYTGITLIGNGQ